MEKSPADMEDVALARDLIVAIAGHAWQGKGDMIERVYAAINRRFPKWSRRRVRAIWHQEAAGVRLHEIAQLAVMADAAQELANARKEHAAFVAKTAALTRFLERQDADFHCHQIAALGRVSGRMGSAGA